MEKSKGNQDRLYYIFNEMMSEMGSEAEAIEIDRTELLQSWFKEKINNGELIVAQIRGEVRTGKSTAGIMLTWMINKYLAKCGKNPDAEKGMWKYIFGDQTEFLRFINEDVRNIACNIDEFSSMAKTGANSTTEEALFDHYSDIFAGQYIHRVSMGTDKILDKNTVIILDTIGKDKENGITYCKLSYRDVRTGRMLCIGRVELDIKPLVRNWIGKGLRDLIETNGSKDTESLRLINEYKRKDFYVKYQYRKYQRMDLMKKEGVRDVRELEFANIVLEVLAELQELSMIGKVDRDLIMVEVDRILRKNKRIYSLIAKQEIATKAQAVLSTWTKMNSLNKKTRITSHNKPTPEEVEVYKKIIRRLKKNVDENVEEFRKLSRLYKEYLEIES